MSFLQYAYLQTGQNEKAFQLIDALKDVPGISAAQLADDQAAFRIRYSAETHDWKMATQLESTSSSGWPQAWLWWARAIGAARLGDVAGAQAAASRLDEATNVAKASDKQQGRDVKPGKTIDELEAEAWVNFAEGKQDDAVQTMRAAADREDRDGVDSISIPAREMLGDLLMEARQPQAALEAYRIVLKESPNRLHSRQGAMLAAQLASTQAVAAGSK
jgi:tetratricopeptide (TPR) repeat protein